MRIVAGRWRGRRIIAPTGNRVRPTADRIREAWMSIVGPWIPGARVIDLFAGSGALGLEALSRGAAVAEFVENAAGSLTSLRANITTLGADDQVIVHRGDAVRFVQSLEPHAFDIAFADPPYDLGLGGQLAERWLAVPFADILGVEHRLTEHLPGEGERRRYGDTVITFFRA